MVGDSLDGVVSFTWRLVQRLLSVGEVTVDNWLAMRGIFVGVSFKVVGDVELGTAPEGKCMDCDEERRKKGMEEGVRHFDGPDPWCMEEVGLNDAGGGSEVVFVLALAEGSILFG